MPKGIALPIRVGPWGGVVTCEGDENDDKIITLALGSDDNENAFQQNIGLGEAMIFDTSDASTRGKIIARLREIFRKFEVQKRYKLMIETLRWIESPGTGDLIMEFKYLVLESDEIQTFSKTLKSGATNG